jgi:hypothetical protein
MGNIQSIKNFQLIPEELTSQIFSFLEARDLLIISMTCKLFANIGSDYQLWKALIEKDFPRENIISLQNSNDTRGLNKSTYKQLTMQEQKNANLKNWITFFSYLSPEIKEESPPVSSKQHYQNLCDRLLDLYFIWSGQDYSKLGKVFRISNQPLSEEIVCDEGKFSFESIEQEHKKTLLTLLREAVKKDQKLNITFENDPVPQGLQPMHIELLQQVFEGLPYSIELSLCNAKLMNKDIPFLSHLIAKGKINTLHLDDNLIDDNGLDLLLESGRSPQSQLSSLTLYNNPLTSLKHGDYKFTFGC